MSVIPNTHVYFLLDRSGSMAGIKLDVIGGFNQFIREQQNGPDKCRFTLVQFDGQNHHEVLFDAVNIDKQAVELTERTFVPRGSTPLLDATDLIITRAENRETQRVKTSKAAEAIVVVTFTDGMENASTRVTTEALKARVEHFTGKGWRFVYLGANQDSFTESNRMGYVEGAQQDWAATTVGTRAAYGASSAAVSNLRVGNATGRTVAACDVFNFDTSNQANDQADTSTKTVDSDSST